MTGWTLESCPKCGMKRRQAEPGSITQWISACQCAEFSESAEDVNSQILLCETCNKRIQSGRIGSLTQWVFRSDLCRCEKPVPTVVSSSSDPTVPPPSAGKMGTLRDSPALRLDRDSFPYDRYTPIRELGRGGAGIVYLAHDERLGKDVAIKCLRVLNARQLMDFQREAQATSKLNHPLIVKVYDFGALPNGAPYMVMEYVNGVSLKQLVETGGPLREEDALPMFANLARAFAHAHKHGILHRDVKSSNVIVVHQTDFSVDPENPIMDVRIIDFGVAAFKSEKHKGRQNAELSQKGQVSDDRGDAVVPLNRETSADRNITGLTLAGTPAYMSPDQLNGRPYDVRSEIYSLGCMLYEALTGAPPFVGESALETLNMHANTPVARPSTKRPGGEISSFTDDVVSYCLEKDPEKRYISMNALATHIDKLLYSRFPIIPEEPAETTDGDKPPKVIPSNLIFFAIIVGLCALSVGLLTFCFNLMGPRQAAISPSPALSSHPMRKSEKAAEENSWPAAEAETRIYCPLPERLVIEDGSDKSLDKFLSSRAVNELQLLRCQLTANGIRKLQDRSLRRLALADCNLEPGAAALLSTLNTRILSLRKTHLGGASYAFLENLRVQELTIDDTAFGDRQMDFVARMPQLKSFSLMGSSSFTGVGLQRLSGRPLQKLELFKLSILDEKNLHYIASISGLETLNFVEALPAGARVSGEEAVSEAITLRTRPKSFELSSFRKITTVRSIRNLAIDSDRLTHEHYELLSQMDALSSLCLEGRNYINPRDVALLAKIGSLRHLRFFGPCIERVGLEKVCSMPRLLRLILLDVDLTDSDLSLFQKSNLQFLSILGENSISDSGLRHLAKMPSLAILRLPRVSFITSHGVEEFARAKPKCRIEQNG